MDDLDDLLVDTSDTKPKKKGQSFLSKFKGNASPENKPKTNNLFQTFTMNSEVNIDKEDDFKAKTSNDNINTENNSNPVNTNIVTPSPTSQTFSRRNKNLNTINNNERDGISQERKPEQQVKTPSRETKSVSIYEDDKHKKDNAEEGEMYVPIISGNSRRAKTPIGGKSPSFAEVKKNSNSPKKNEEQPKKPINKTYLSSISFGMGQSPEDEDWANDDIEKVETKVNTTPVNRRDIRNDIRNKDIQDFSGQKEQPKKDIKETKEVKEKSLKEIYDVESLKEKIKEDKERSDTFIKEEQINYKKKEELNNKFIDDLNDNYKKDNKFLEETYTSQIKLLTEENKNLRLQFEREMTQEREKLNYLNKTSLENQEMVYKSNLDSQKRMFEEQNETLKKQLQQQIEINKIANKVESSSKFIDEIIVKMKQDKEHLYENENTNLKNKEHMLKTFETQIAARERNIEIEREELNKFRNELEKRDLEVKKNQNDEKRRIEKEVERINELQKELKVLEHNSKEKFELERQSMLSQVQKDKNECEKIKTQSKELILEYESKLKILNDEKSFFESFKEEANKNNEYKQKNLEEKRKELINLNADMKNKSKMIEDRERHLNEKEEKADATFLELKNMRASIERDKRDIALGINSLESKLKKYEENNRILENERENLIKKHNELETDKIILNTEKIKIEQQYADIRLRTQNLDMLRIKYVTNNSSFNTGTEMPLMMQTQIPESSLKLLQPQFSQTTNNKIGRDFSPSVSPLTNQNFNLRKNEMDAGLSKTVSNFNNNNNKQFTCDNYMFDLKNRVSVDTNRSKQSSSNYINQEQEYLKRSYQTYNEFDSKLNNDSGRDGRDMKNPSFNNNMTNLSNQVNNVKVKPESPYQSKLGIKNNNNNNINTNNSNSNVKPKQQDYKGVVDNLAKVNNHKGNIGITSSEKVPNQLKNNGNPSVSVNASNNVNPAVTLNKSVNSVNPSVSVINEQPPKVVNVEKPVINNHHNLDDIMDKEIVESKHIDLNMNDNNEIADEEFEL